ncbi:FAD-dependent oxidoreductase [Candidatus Peregrinibacteria bacterium]|nr:FAD-dependent oxidoreductase [Candidatus Peregrinibacteria bacterium]
MVNPRKKIVVLGAGIAGIRIVQDLADRISTRKWQIILVDLENAHVYRADLYEVATAFNSRITEKCLVELKKTVATPIADLIDRKTVKFMQDEVVGIDSSGKKVRLKKNGIVKYDFLAVALGSETNYFEIPGLKKYGLPLKTVENAIKINYRLNRFFVDLRKNGARKNVNIYVGGGGATGVEVAGELIGFVKKICGKYDYPIDKVKVVLVEAARFLAGMNEKGTKIILKRLAKLGVKEIVRETIGDKTRGGAIAVNSFLQKVDDPCVFAAGDNAWFEMKNGGRLEMLAQAAYQEGALIAKNILRMIDGEEMIEFKPTRMHYVVPVGGKFGVWMVDDGRVFSGWWVWLVKRLIYLKYAMSIMPFRKAVKKWLHSRKVFAGND